MLLNYRRTQSISIYFSGSTGGGKTCKFSETKAVVLAQLSFARASLGQGKLPRVPISSHLLEVTLLCQHRLSFDSWTILFQFCLLVTLAFSLESFKSFETFSDKTLSPCLLHDLSSHFKKNQIRDCIVTCVLLQTSQPTPYSSSAHLPPLTPPVQLASRRCKCSC